MNIDITWTSILDLIVMWLQKFWLFINSYEIPSHLFFGGVAVYVGMLLLAKHFVVKLFGGILLFGGVTYILQPLTRIPSWLQATLLIVVLLYIVYVLSVDVMGREKWGKKRFLIPLVGIFSAIFLVGIVYRTVPGASEFLQPFGYIINLGISKSESIFNS